MMVAREGTTEDAVLGGRLWLRQPRRGHRIGHDAMLLAAAASARAGEHAVELGAGVGAAGLALAHRMPGLRVSLVEIDPALAAMARENAQANRLDDRVTALTLDVTAAAEVFAAAGLPPGCAQQVLMNPPFNDPASQQISPDAQRARAHAADRALASWTACAKRLLAVNGTLTLIWRADGLTEVLDALDGFGGVAIKPVYPHADKPAIRILVRAEKGSRAPLQLLPGLILNDLDGRPTAAAEAILRHAQPLPLA
jgi:tRNA1(Val) A37 N6-methylase TrmN6